MKTLTLFALCAALACSAAHADPAGKPASKTTSAATAAAHNPALFGFWKSVSAEGVILPGTMEFRADGSAELAPKGEEKLKGTWTTKGSELKLTMPPYGTAQMQYAVTSKGMTLTYENGMKQKFVKETTKK